MKEVGYHGTCSKYRNEIDTNGFDPEKTKFRLDHWLGQGVYFFDDYDIAKWWADSVSSHNKGYGGVVYRVDIEALDDEVLNLGDWHQMDLFTTEIINSIDEIKKYCPGSMPIMDTRQFRGVFFDYYKETQGIAVIIAFFPEYFAGYTAKRNQQEKEMQKQLMDIIGLRYLQKQICVSRKECIKSTKMIYNEEEEVI